MLLPADEIHVWCIREALEDTASMIHLLSTAELQRLARLRQPRMRSQFVVTRAAVRAVLSAAFPAIASQHWQFERNPWGRPEIGNPELRGRVSFNIAHTEGLIVIALCCNGTVGVDVENLSRIARAGALARRYFSASEAAALHALPQSQQLRRFLDLWTLKEAYIKACGMGLAIALDSFGFVLQEGRVAIEFAPQQQDDPARWQFWQLQIGEGFLAGLALSDARELDVRVRCRSFCHLQPGPDEVVQIIRKSAADQ